MQREDDLDEASLGYHIGSGIKVQSQSWDFLDRRSDFFSSFLLLSPFLISFSLSFFLSCSLPVYPQYLRQFLII